ncbi:hypothetical protein FRB98_005298 [Tulasnella sp. 332]|nr:hypothetical protein FRB98_005298 [Tulasnella sp. 332]
MGRTDNVRRPLTAAARSQSNPYASSYDQVASPLSFNFPPLSAGYGSGGGGGHSSSQSDSPPSYDHFTIPTHLNVTGTGAPQLLHASHPSSNGVSTPAAREELPEGTYALEPDEFGSYPGFPSVAEYEDIQESYLRNLSSRKQEKALITQAMYDSIHAVLMDPTNTSFGTPQFRFWVRKMFVLAAFQGEYTVTHEDKPVAAKEQIYQILVHCHGECYHGGRDKTCTQIKQYYSWIPKELVAQFVKACPTCVLKRSNNPKKFVAMLKDIGGAGGGPDDEYVDYFTSPTKQQSQVPGQKSTRVDMGARYIKPEPSAVPLSLDDTFGTFVANGQQIHHQQSQNQHQLHQHHQPHVYTPGVLDESMNNVNHLGSVSLSDSSSSQSLSHRPSGSGVIVGGVNRQTSGGVSSHARTPLSGVFPGNIYAEFDQQSQQGGGSGWPSQQQYGGAMMGRQGGRSFDDAQGGRYTSGFPPPFHPSQQGNHTSHASGSAAMGYSFSDGSLPSHPINGLSEDKANGQDGDDNAPPPSVPSRMCNNNGAGTFYGLPTFAVSSSDYQQQHLSNGVIDIDADGSLVNMQYQHQSPVGVKVEDTTDDSSLAANANVNLLPPSSTLVNRRRRGLAPVALNLDLSGSNFADYRGGGALLSATTPTSAVSSEYGAINSPAGDWTLSLHHPRPEVPLRSASLLSLGGGGSDMGGGNGPGSAVAAQFPQLTLGGLAGAGAEGEEEMGDVLSALDVLASSAIGSFDQLPAEQQLSSFAAGFEDQQLRHHQQMNGFAPLNFQQQLEQHQYQQHQQIVIPAATFADIQLPREQVTAITASEEHTDYADDLQDGGDGEYEAQVDDVVDNGEVEVIEDGDGSDEIDVLVGQEQES